MGPRNHENVHGFLSSTVPAMEENLVLRSPDPSPKGSVPGENQGERESPGRAPERQGGDGRDFQEHGGFAESKDRDIKANGDVEPRDPKTDDQPPHAVYGKNDTAGADAEVIHVRVEVREHPSTKFNPRTQALSTSTPTVDPHGFEDPISDAFWKKVWTACAVHNVSRSVEGNVDDH